MKLLYPTSLALDVKSLEGYSVDLIPYDVKQHIPDEHLDAEALLAWTVYLEVLGQLMMCS